MMNGFQRLLSNFNSRRYNKESKRTNARLIRTVLALALSLVGVMGLVAGACSSPHLSST
jgi:hypothetical protein